MTSQLIQIGWKKYASGLFWQPVGGGRTASQIAASISAAAKNSNFKYYAEYRNMVGLAEAGKNYYSGLTALAPEVAESFGNSPSFLSAFKINGGYWIVAARNGVILSDSDKYFENSDEGKKFFNSLVLLPDWGLIVAPEEWEIPGSEFRDINDVISGKVKSNLKPINTSFQFFLKLILLGLVVILCILISIPLLEKSYSEPDQKMTSESIQRYREQIERKKLSSAPKTAPSVYSTVPDKDELAAVCEKSIAFVMQPIYGWVTVSASCENGKISAHIRRTYGTVEELAMTVNSLMPGMRLSILGDAGNEAQITGKIAILPGKENMPNLSAAEIETLVRSIFQQTNMPANIQVVKDKTNFMVSVSADSKIMPTEFAKFFDGIPAVELVSISWDGLKNQWSYKEIIYAK